MILCIESVADKYIFINKIPQRFHLVNYVWFIPIEGTSNLYFWPIQKRSLEFSKGHPYMQLYLLSS